jgi:YbbR domain-containing protein
MMLAGEVPGDVEVRVRGPRSLIRTTANKRMVKTIDLAGMETGEHVFQVGPDDLDLPPGVQVVQISPVRLRVPLAKTYQQMLPVRPVLHGHPAEGFEVREVSFKPDAVIVVGLKEEIDNLDWIWTLPIDISGISESTTFKSLLRLPTGQVRLRPDQVEAFVAIVPKGGKPKRSGGDQE